MMEDGFLSRFLHIEYNGLRPRLNDAQFIDPPHALADAVADLCTHPLTLLSRQQTTFVDRTAKASEMLARFEIECDDIINATDDESQRQMWNRASLKVMRLSALLAVCDNHLAPVIQEQHVAWALDVINRDINIMKRRFEAGDIGSGDQAKMKKVIYILKDYLRNGAAASHKIPKEMYEAAIVTRRLLQKRTYQAPAFSNHKNGSAYALDMTLKNLIDDGYIAPVNDTELVKKYGYHGKCFRIIGVL